MMWPGFDTCKVRLDSLSPRDTLADAETAEQISIIAGSFKSISLTHGQEEPIYDTDHTDLNSDFDELDLRAELLKDKWRFLFDKFDPEGFGEIPVNDFLVALKSPEFQSQVPLSKRELLYDRALLSAEPKGGSGSVSFQDFVNVKTDAIVWPISIVVFLFVAMFFYEFVGIVFILYLACKYSHRVEYYAKFTFFVLGTAASCAVFPYVGLFLYPIRDFRNGLLPAWGFRLTVNLLGLEYEYRGLENIDRNEGGVMVVAPHQSSLDLAVVAYLWPVIGRGTAVIKRFLLYAFPFGIGVWLCGTLFIDRKNKQDAVQQLQMQLEAIQNRTNKIIIFPEGTRSQIDKLLPFKKGAFHLAIDSQSMIQPVVVSKYHFLDSKEKYFRKGKIIISILPAISCKGMGKNDVNAVLEQTKQIMDSYYHEISNETKSCL